MVQFITTLEASRIEALDVGIERMVALSREAQPQKTRAPNATRHRRHGFDRLTNVFVTLLLGITVLAGAYFSVVKYNSYPPDFDITLKEVCKRSTLPRLKYEGVESFFQYLLSPDKTFCRSWIDFTQENKTLSRERRSNQYGRRVCADNSTGESCLVYHFTVIDNEQFKKDMDKLTCNVHEIVDELKHEVDESQKAPWRHAWQISQLSYDKILPGGSVRSRRSLKDIALTLGHVGRKVSLLRADLLWHEWTLLRQVITYHNLLEVQQITAGLHVPHYVSRLSKEGRYHYFANLFKVFEGLTCLGYKHVLVTAIESQGNHLVIPEMANGTLPSFYSVHWVKTVPQSISQRVYY